MGLGFNAFEDFVDTEDDGFKKNIFVEKPEEEVDVESKQYKEIKRGIKKNHKDAGLEAIERLTRERLKEVRQQIELAN